MKFTEWFDTKNPEHMELAVYLYEHGNWPFHTQLDSLDQSDRHAWPIQLASILAMEYIKNYKENRAWRKFLYNFNKCFPK